MKTCTKCNAVKPYKKFPYRKPSIRLDGKPRKGGYHAACKECTNIVAYKYLASTYTEAEKMLRGRESMLMRYYGITVADYEEMYRKQEGKCLICQEHQPLDGKRRRMAVDHDHSYPKGVKESVRGLLCSQCNMAIGLLNDNPSVVTRAAAYLQSYAN